MGLRLIVKVEIWGMMDSFGLSRDFITANLDSLMNYFWNIGFWDNLFT
jgi:hypothetical protein